MKYLVSGIGPSDWGVGRLMRAMGPRYKSLGYSVVYRRMAQSIRQKFRNGYYLQAFLELPNRYLGLLAFNMKCYFMKSATVIVVHPQTIGFARLFRLIERNTVSIYVVDNSFFCIRSYNTNPVSNTECLKCLNSIVPDDLCQPFPVGMDKEENILFLKKLKEYSNSLTFLAQSDLQRQLLQEHFGVTANIRVIGMDTGEIEASRVKYLESINFVCQYDIVFHGASIIAKGLLYVVELAEELPEYRFLVPDEIQKVRDVTNRPVPNNIICKKMTWETGLKHAVINARLVLNPSLWSATIEGALLKSAAFNKNVATIRTQFGYEAEIKIITNHLRLDQDVKSAAQKIRAFLNDCA